jgi:hypothetical protein
MFEAKNKCIEEPPLENGSCEPDFYLGKCKCVCDSGYYLSKDEPRRCIGKLEVIREGFRGSQVKIS